MSGSDKPLDPDDRDEYIDRAYGAYEDIYFVENWYQGLI